jgi:hypothetical protein
MHMNVEGEADGATQDSGSPPDPRMPNNDYRRARRYEVLRSGGRGCLPLGVMLMGSFFVALALSFTRIA